MTPIAKPKRRWKGKTLLIWTVVGAIAVFALLSLIADFHGLVSALENFPPHILLEVGLLALGNYLLRFIKWHWYLSSMNHRIAPGPNALVFVSAFAFTVTPAKVGEFIKAFILKARYRVPYTVSTAVLLMERFTDVLAILLLSFSGLLLGSLNPFWTGGAGALIVVFLLLVRNKKFVRAIIEWLGRFKRLRGITEDAHEFYDYGWGLMAPGIFTGSMILSLAAWFLEGFGYYLVANGLGFHLSILEGVFIYSASIMGGALTLFLGGLGATEGSLVGLGIIFGMSNSLSVAAAIIIRIMTLWLAVVIGWLAFLFTPTLRSLLGASYEDEPPTSELL
ncbi:hypothetical protein BMS3Abin14_01849 [bacterium BMS3Abin14]|nr:hypothetical protein BMS3Abin14_01849 [bacterium BMS3Abin14]